MSSAPAYAKIVGEYVYMDAEDQPFGKVIRKEWDERDDVSGELERKKNFSQCRFENHQYIFGLGGRKLPVYNLPRVLHVAAHAGSVFLVEGEKCADRLNEELKGRNAVATTIAGGSNAKMAAEHREPLRGAKKVAVLCDADACGRDAAKERADFIREVIDDVRLIEFFPAHNDGSDIVDWLDEGHTLDQLREHVELAPIVERIEAPNSDALGSDEKFEALPDFPNVDERPWPIMDEAAFHGLAGELVRKIAPYTEADQAALLLTLLTLFGSAAGPNSYAQVHADRHPPRFFFVLVAATADGKGASLAVLRLFYIEADAEWLSVAERSGFSSGEAIIADLSGELEVEPSPYQKIALLIEEELTGLLIINSREGSTTSQRLRAAWDGGRLSTIRRNKKICVDGAHVSLLGHVVPQELRKRLSFSDAVGGFANRCLFVSARRARKLPEPEPIAQATIRGYGQRLRSAIEFARQGRVMERTPEAKRLWAALYHAEPERSGLIGSLTARAAAQKLRLSVAYALLDKSPKIDVPHILAAEAVWRFNVASVTREFGSELSDIERKLLDATKKAWPGTLPYRSIYALFNGHLSKSEIQGLVAKLEERLLLERERNTTGGRPSLSVRRLTREQREQREQSLKEAPATGSLYSLYSQFFEQSEADSTYDQTAPKSHGAEHITTVGADVAPDRDLI